jgi:hypothetical protein
MKKHQGQFLHSFAHIDGDGWLLYWDDGFVQEIRFAAEQLMLGVSCSAAIVQPRLAEPFVKEYPLAKSALRDSDDLLQDGLTGFEADRSGEYWTLDGRIIRVDRHRARSNGIWRFAREVTEERSPGERWVNAHQQLGAADSAWTVR